MANGRVSLPELNRKIEQLEDATDKRFDKIEGTLQWIARLIVATMFSVIGAILIAYLTRQG